MIPASLCRLLPLALLIVCGLAAPAGAATLTPTPGFGDLSRGASISTPYLLTATATGRHSISVVSGTGPTFKVDTNPDGSAPCTQLLFTGGACSFAITVDVPIDATPGPYSSTLVIRSDAGTTQSFALAGNVRQDNWSANPINLGTIPLGPVAPANATITNDGDAPLTVTDVYGDIGIQTPTTSLTVPAHSSRSLPFEVSTFDAGAGSANLTVVVNAPGSPVRRTVPVTWNAVGPRLELTQIGRPTFDGPQPPSVNAGGTAAVQLVAKNVGNQPLKLTSLGFAPGYSAGPYALGAFGLPRTIAPGASLSLPVTITPTGQVGFADTVLSIGSDDPTGSPTRIGLLTRVTAPTITIAPTALDYGTKLSGTTNDQTFRITNNGTGTLNLTNMRILGTGEFSIYGSNSRMIPPGVSIDVGVAFTPAGRGAKSATLAFNSNVGGSSSHTLALSGTGVLPALLQPSLGAVAFGDVVVGQSPTAIVDLRNIGDAPLTVSSVTATGGGFTVSGGTGAIAPGASRPVTVRFTPTTRGAVTGSIAVASTAGDQTIGLSARGTGPQGDWDAPTIDLGTIPAGTTTTRNLNLLNTGEEDLHPTGATVTGSAGVSLTGLPATVGFKSQETVQLKITPTATGAVDATVTVDSDSVAAFPLRVVATVTRTYPGSIAFARDEELSLDARPSKVVAADFDSDGQPDLAAASADTGAVWTLHGNGDGTFDAPVTLSGTPAAGVFGLATADLDGDSDADLTTGGRIFLGNGDGTFAAGISTSLVGGDVLAADVDANGDQDLVLTDVSAGNLRIALGAGDGTFAPPTSYPVTAQPSSPIATDLDRDGDLDLAVGGRDTADRSVTVLRGDGAGHFTTERYATSFPAASIAVGDLNGDLRPDLSTGSQQFPGRADGTLGPVRAAASRNEALAIADFTGDGNEDQVVTGASNTGIFLSPGLGDGTFDFNRTFQTFSSGGSQPADLATADLDGDGRADLIAAKGGPRLDVLVNGNAAVSSGAGKALISEVRFGSDGYLTVRNRSRTAALRLDGWQLRFSGGSRLVLPPSTLVQPGGVLLVASPANGGSSLNDIARSVLPLPAAARGVRLVDAAGELVDAAGTTAAASGFREGAGLPAVTFVGQGAYVRKSSAGAPVDTGDNAADFRALDTAADEASGTVLGAPRPDGAFAPTNRNDILQSSLLDPAVSQSALPNRVITPGDATTATLLTINRTVTNCSGGLTTGVCVNADASAPAVAVTKLRFRITDLSTFGGPVGARLVAVASADASYGALGVKGLPLDGPSLAAGGGINSTLTATSLLPAGGLAPGQSINVAFTFEVYAGGSFAFAYDTEDDVTPYEAPKAGDVPKADAPAGDTHAQKPPAAEPVREQATGTVPQSAISSAPAPALTPKAPVKTTPAKRCVSRAKYKRLSRKQRAKVRICAPKTTSSKTTNRTR